MLLTRSEVIQLTDLQGFRYINHQSRKRLLIRLATKYFKAGARVADIGCAAGDLTMELQAVGFQMTGMDFEQARLKKAHSMAERHRLAVEFLFGDVRNAIIQEQFDGMIMGEILEHFFEPRKILEQHLEVLKPKGIILITVPNVASLRARLKLLFWGEFADHNPEHHFYFTRRRFQEYFRESPIEILEIFTFLVELTLICNETWARTERLLLSPLVRVAPWCGSNLVVVVRKR